MPKQLVCNNCGRSEKFYTTVTEYYDCTVDNQGKIVDGTKTLGDSCNDGREYVCTHCEGFGFWKDSEPIMLQMAKQTAKDTIERERVEAEKLLQERHNLCSTIASTLRSWGFDASIAPENANELHRKVTLKLGELGSVVFAVDKNRGFLVDASPNIMHFAGYAQPPYFPSHFPSESDFTFFKVLVQKLVNAAALAAEKMRSK